LLCRQIFDIAFLTIAATLIKTGFDAVILRFNQGLIQGLIYLLFLLAAIWPATAAYSAEADAHDHLALVKTSSLTFVDVLEQAVVHAPEYLADSARQQQSAAWRKLGQSLVQGNPRVALSYINDRFNDDVGTTEIETGLEWQLWSWGARRDTERYGERLGLEYSAWRQYLRLAVAGKLRSVMADIALAELQVEQHTLALTQAEHLLKIARQRFDAGDISRDAVLQAENFSLNAQDALLAARAGQVDAAREYQFLAGTNLIPAEDWIEQPPADATIDPDHPLLMLLATQVEIASSRIALARHQASGSPSLYLGMRRERPDRVAEYADSLNVGISYPLGGGRLVSAQVSDASRAKTDAQVAYETAWRQLQQQLHEVQHEWLITSERLETAQAQVAIANRRADMARIAFEEGETTVFQAVQALQQARDISAHQQQLVVHKRRLASMLNQTLGLMP